MPAVSYGVGELAAEYCKQCIEELIMATAGSGVSEAFRRLMKNVDTWLGALNYSGFDYTMDRIAFLERELSEIKDRMRQFEASGLKPQDMPPTNNRAD